MYSSMRNQGLRIINYMINGRLIACLPVKVPMTTKRTVMLLFCSSIFVCGSSAVKELMLGCLYKKHKLWSYLFEFCIRPVQLDFVLVKTDKCTR